MYFFLDRDAESKQGEAIELVSWSVNCDQGDPAPQSNRLQLACIDVSNHNHIDIRRKTTKTFKAGLGFERSDSVSSELHG